MGCYDAGVLSAFLDRELPRKEHWQVEAHLAKCARCQKALAELESQKLLAETALEGLSAISSLRNVPTDKAWHELGNRIHLEKTKRLKGVFLMNERMKKISVAVAAFAVVAGSFGLAPVRSFASQVLDVFRVEKVDTVSIKVSDIEKIRQAMSQSGRMNIENFGSVTTENLNSYRTVNLEEASRVMGVPIKLPSGWGTDGITLHENSAIRVKPKVANVNALLTSLGSKELLPESVDGQEFELKEPAIINATHDQQNANPTSIFIARSPELQGPAGVDVEELRKALLALPVIPDDVRTQLTAINDWRHTLIVPNIEGSTEKVTVNGTEGVFMSPKAPAKHNNRRYGYESADRGHTLLWEKDGVIYAIVGDINLEKALALAAEMR